MLERTGGCLAPLRRTDDESLLQQIRLVDVFQGARIFGESRCQRGKPHGFAVETYREEFEDPVVGCIETERIDLEELEGLGCDLFGNRAIAAYLRPIAHALEQAVRQTRCAAPALGDFERALRIDRNIEDRSGACDDGGKLFRRIVDRKSTPSELQSRI